MSSNELDCDSLERSKQASLLKISQSLRELLTQNGFRCLYDNLASTTVRLNTYFFLGKSPPIGKPWLVSSHMNLLFPPEQAPISSQAAAAAAMAECRPRPSEMFTFQLRVVFNHTAGCLTAHSTAWPLFTSPCFRPALYAQSGRIWAGSFYASQQSSDTGKRSEWTAAWRYTENAPVWLTQSA